MNCESVEPELIGYHFGTLSAETREGVEAHLVECSACVKEFVALKRAIEASDDEAPSASARVRIRRSVELELRSARVVPLRRKWERPLAFGVASAALVLTATLVHLLWVQPGHAPYGLERSATQEQHMR